MKVLFLDIDGVVNCVSTQQRHRGYIGIDPYMAFMVGKIQLDTDCQVVLSSTWRLYPDMREEVAQQVVPFIDVTPDHQGGANWGAKPRGNEIQEWLDKHPEVTRYAILDDNSDMLDSQLPNFFKTEWEVGITEEIAKQVTEHLNAEEEPNPNMGQDLQTSEPSSEVVEPPTGETK